ncbi:hypothetical protein [Cupriavidus basilensis]|uniref:hypothetical protein n=1 Tax=Cupriavidus basilensis TaxID=68895 RepID=UPI0020A6C134|nr:hypothetical protein [Cupriavidus basilensis]MCP3024606.1 hypothetical protein [Cupriavidus basilensis]
MESSCNSKSLGLDPKLGFDIGYDYARYGLHLPSSVREAAEALPPQIFQGHRYGSQKFLLTRPRGDRYVRKWLQLRVNAWRRLRHFDDRITPDYLRTIDLPYCPVTRVTLEHSSTSDTTWSVDRIYNGAGYAPGNLAVTSARANTAKGELTTARVVRILQGESSRQLAPTLTREQWRRQICMMAWSDPSVPSEASSRLTMAVLPPPRTLCHSPFTAFQVVLSLAMIGRPLRNGVDPIQVAIDLVPTKKTRRQIIEMVLVLKRLASLNARRLANEGNGGPIALYAVEDAWASDAVVLHWERIVRKSEAVQFLPAMACLGGRPGKREDSYDGWALASGGYDTPCHN